MNGPMDTRVPGGASLWTDAWRRLRRKRLAMACLGIVILYTGVAVYGEIVYRWHQYRDITPSYHRVNMDVQYLPPSILRAPFAVEAGADVSAGERVFAGIRELMRHPLGTDGLGRDVLQRTVQGTRIAYLVAIMTSLIAFPIAVLLGCLAGYFGGRIDDFIVWLYTTVASIPTLLLILAIAMVVGMGLHGVILGIGLTMWVGVCRLVRGEVIKHRERPYVAAAQALGLGHFRILFRHILPNVFHVVIVMFSLFFPVAVGVEVFLSFLGVGVQGEPSWGIMISNARLRLWHGVWWEMAAATAALFFIVLAFNLLGDALRDALDPRLRTGRQ